MSNAYYEVARTYGRRAVSSWMAAIFVVVVLIQILVTLAAGGDAEIPAFSWGAALLGILLWSHLREHVISEQRRLWPGYIKPHVTVFAILLALVIFGWPGLVMLRGGPQSVGLMAYTAIWIAILGWWVLTLWVPLFFTAFAGWMWVISPHGIAHIRPFIRGEMEPLGGMMLVASLVAIASAIVTMLRQTEETTFYRRKPQFSAWSLRPRMTGETNQAWEQARQSAMFGLPSGAGWAAPTGTSLLARAQRWRRLTRNSSLGMFFIALLMVAGMRLSLGANRGTNPVLLAFLVWMPALMTSGVWVGMWRFLETEMLRPITREAFLKEMGVVIALDLFRGWSAMAAMVAADAMLFSPVDRRTILTWTIASFFLQILAYGVAIHLMRYRHPIKAGLGTMMALMIPACALMAFAMESELRMYPIPVLAGAALLAGVGIMLTKDAHRRWLATELG